MSTAKLGKRRFFVAAALCGVITASIAVAETLDETTASSLSLPGQFVGDEKALHAFASGSTGPRAGSASSGHATSMSEVRALSETAKGNDPKRCLSGKPLCRIEGQDGICTDVSRCAGAASPGHCPGPDNVQCCPDAGDCGPDERPQPNADLVEAPGVHGCPDGMIPVEGFCIDQYEAALEVIHEDGSTSPWSPFWNPGDERVRAVSLPNAVPQSLISGRQAARACAESGKRLCEDHEWLRACQGTERLTYPYGNEREPGRCNDSRGMHPAAEYYKTAEPWIWSALSNPYINQQEDTVARTGEHEDCASAEGVFDMMGNLHEWTANRDGVFRGGYYMDTVQNGPGCLYVTGAHGVGYSDYSTGFRCCADQ